MLCKYTLNHALVILLFILGTYSGGLKGSRSLSNLRAKWSEQCWISGLLRPSPQWVIWAVLWVTGSIVCHRRWVFKCALVSRRSSWHVTYHQTGKGWYHLLESPSATFSPPSWGEAFSFSQIRQPISVVSPGLGNEIYAPKISRGTVRLVCEARIAMAH